MSVEAGQVVVVGLAMHVCLLPAHCVPIPDVAVTSPSDRNNAWPAQVRQANVKVLVLPTSTEAVLIGTADEMLE